MSPALKLLADVAISAVMKKTAEQTPKPKYVKGAAKEIAHEIKENREFDPKRAIISAILGVLFAWAVSEGHLTSEQADIIDDVVEEKVLEAVE